MVMVSSSGKIILLGEHAVVYDKLGISAAAGKYTNISINSSNDDSIFIKSNNLGLKDKKNKDEIFKLTEQIDKLREEGKINEIKDMAKRDKLLPSFLVIGKIMMKYGFRPCSIEIRSEVPKNLGSSASVFNGIAKGLSEFLGLNLDKEKIGCFANEGDKVVHGTPSGIDAYTIAYGGWNIFKKSEGIKSLDNDLKISLIIVDSGEPARTGEMVASIRKQKEENPSLVDAIMNKLDIISRNGLDSLKSHDLKSIGISMIKYYHELKKLNISIPKLDEIVEIAIKNNLLGAKPTGGWGGGSCIVLAKDEKQVSEIINIYKTNGFNAFAVKLGVECAK